MLVDLTWPESLAEPNRGLVRMRAFMLEHRAYFQRMVARVSDGLRLHSSGKFAELGCGAGLLSLELATSGARVYSMDISPESLQPAHRVAGYFDLRATFTAGDMHRLPFADESLDGIVAISVFEHLADRDAALQEIIRVLKPGGWLTIEDGNLLKVKGLFDLLFLYPLRTRGKSGGIDWLLNRSKVRPLYGGKFIGRDEDWKTTWWWQRYLAKFPELCHIKVSTTKQYDWPNAPAIMALFFGSIRAVAQKRG